MQIKSSLIPKTLGKAMLPAALALVSQQVIAQSTTGSVFGSAPAGADETVVATGAGGVIREVPVDDKGRYRIGNLPVGTYTVSLKQRGKVVDARKGINLIVNTSTNVSFVSTSGAKTLDTISVAGKALPKIDVTSVDSRTVVTSQQLAMLPLGRSAEAIAMLAPGAVKGSSAFGNVVSFGGASVAENAYYINGFNTSDPLKNIGGLSLPYGSIDQEEVYTGGYSAMYGRSDGGVISQVGKRGTNDWHFGGQVLWEPANTHAGGDNTYLSNGWLYDQNKNDKSWRTVYSAYLGGPLIKDKLFFFLSAEAEKTAGNSVGSEANDSNALSSESHYKYSLPKWYGKIDWNVTDSNILELTGMSSLEHYHGYNNYYDYSSNTQEGFKSHSTSHKTGGQVYIAKWTSYITDNLTFSATYGKSKRYQYYNTPGYDSSIPYVGGTEYEDPSITGGNTIINSQSTSSTNAPDQGSRSRGLRLDLSYDLGNHRLQAGIDNQTYKVIDQGTTANEWIYEHGDPDTAISSGLGVGAPGGDGYYVDRYIYSTLATVHTVQRAQYIEDSWQVTDRWLLRLGLRDDQFTNYNTDSKAYAKQKNQWAPRLGFSWDVMGDASLKVFGNIGRYYLAMPTNVAIRAAAGSLYTNQYFTYTGIAADGSPTGLTALSNPVSSDNEYGNAPDPKTVSASNLKSEYQDEAILGFEKTLGSKWVAGANVTVRKLENAIDDVCDSDKLVAKLASQGVDTSTASFNGCYLFNPGKTNTFKIAKNGGGYYNVSMSTADWGFNEGVKRKYYGLNLFLSHPFDGKWMGRLDYTFSRSYGNSEGLVRSDIGQSDVSTTEDWDFASLMENSNGILSNDRTHEIKATGAYKLTPEWMVSGHAQIMSGAPSSCLGYYGSSGAEDPSGYNGGYHWCGGERSRAGYAGRLPWTHQYDLSVTYEPDFAHQRLGLQLSVFNILNEQKATLVSPTYNSAAGVKSVYYRYIESRETPRYVRLSLTYDY